MTAGEFNPLPDFFLLLAEAHHAARAVDNFDLRSDIPGSEAEFDRLCAEQTAACMALSTTATPTRPSLKRLSGRSDTSPAMAQSERT